MVTKRKTAKSKSSTASDTKNNTEAKTVGTCEAIQISIRMGVYIALTLFLLTGIWGVKEYIRTPREPAEITFTGTGEYYITNNTATIAFTFSETQKEVTKARDTVTRKAYDAYTELARLGIAEKDIQTTNYTIHPEYKYTPRPLTGSDEKELIGYRAAHTTTIIIRNLDAMGTILNSITNLQPTILTGPTFMPDEENRKAAEEIAIAKALYNAKTRAYTIADMTHIRLKKITDITIYDSNPPSYRKLGTAAAVHTDDIAAYSSESIPIYQGENKIAKTAKITFQIEQD